MKNKITALLLTFIMAISYVSPVAYAANISEPIVYTTEQSGDTGETETVQTELTQPSDSQSDDIYDTEIPTETESSETKQESSPFSSIDDDIVRGGLCGELVEWMFYASGRLVISGIGEMTEFASYSDVPWYAYSSGITSVVFEDSVTSIGSYAFFGCTALEEITFTESITKIGKQSFAECTALTSAILPESLETIGNSAFVNCTSLKTVSLPESLISLGTGAFANCTALQYITVPAIADIPDNCFNSCSALETVVLPEQLKTIGSNSFANCTSLKAVSMPDTVTTIGSGAFSECTSLESVYLSACLETVSDYAFYNCSLIREVIIPDSVNAVGNYAFYECSSIKNISISPNVTFIGNYSFSGCTSVKNIQLPSDIEKIGDFAFANCTELESINLPKHLASIGESAFSCCVALKEVVVPESITEIKPNTFENCRMLETVSLPQTLVTLGGYSFSGCTSLTEITLHNNVISIGDGAFAECSSLKMFTAPSSLGALGEKIFYNCTNLTDVSLPDSLKTIGDYTFYECTSLENVTVPSDLEFIGSCGFSGCMALTEIILPEGLTHIGSSAFSNCVSLVNISLPGTLTYIGNSAFSCCVSLKSIEIPEGITEIPANAFEICRSLENVVLPDTLISVGNYSFSGCASLSEITLPDSIRYLNDGAFSECTALASVNLPDGLVGIGSNAFAYCTELKSLNIPASVTDISASAFAGMSADIQITTIGGSAADKLLKEQGFENLVTISTLKGLVLPAATNIELYKQAQAKLTINPSNAPDVLSLEWKTEDETIATVDADGLITAVSLGSTVLTVTDLNSGKSATTVVTVKLPAKEKITVTPDREIDAIGLEEGESRTLTVFSATAGEIAADKLNFTSSAPAVVSVDENGVITSLYTGAGTKTVTITATLKSDKTKTVKFTVKAIAKQINLIKIYAEFDETVPEEYKEQIEIAYPYNDNTPVIIIPKGLVANGVLPINLKAVSVDAGGNETAANVKWSSDASAVAAVAAVKAAKGQAANEVWGLAKATVKKNAKANGLAVITATANDVKKTTSTIEIDVRDYTPRLESNTVTLNTNKTGGAQVKLYTAYDAILQDYSAQLAMLLAESTQVIDVMLEGKGSENFYAVYDSESSVVTFNSNDVVKNGTYKLTLKINTLEGETGQAVTVKVANKLPAVTLKQLASFNRFYKDSTADVTVTVKNETITKVELTDTQTFAATEYNAETNSITLVYADTDYPLSVYDAKGKPDVSAKVNVYLEGYRTPVVKTLSIKHNETKPKLSQSRSSTAYTYLSNTNSPLQIIETVDKNTKLSIDFSEGTEYTVSLAETSNGYVTLGTNGTDILLATILGDNNKFTNNSASHTAKIEVNHNNWLKPIIFSHKITVNAKKPTVKVKTATLAIKSLYNSEAITELTASIANCPVPVRYEISAVKANENTDKISVTAENWTVKASFKDMSDLPANGNYKYSIVPVVVNSKGEEESLAAFTVTVNVNNKVPTIKPAQSTVTLKGESYTGIMETDITVNPADCPEIRYEIVPANTKQQSNTDKLVVTAEGRTVKVGFADVNDLPANGSYKYTIKGFITDAAGNETALAATAITVKVATAAPKVTLEKTAVTLNKNVAEKASFGVKSVTAGYEVVDMTFTTANTKAEGKLAVSYDNQSGLITAKVADPSLANGTYTYSGIIAVKVADEAVTTTKELKATVKVTVKSGAVSLKTSAKGSIDLANRSNGITYTVTGINNYNYAAETMDKTTFTLTGTDADKFDIIYTGLNAKGQHTVMVTAKADAQLNNKAKYSYNIAVNVDGIAETVTLTKAVTVTTKQTGLKFTTSGSTTVYQSYKGSHSFTVDVKTPVGAQIADVKILSTKATTVPEGALVYTITKNEETGSWTVSCWVSKASKLKVNKTYKLALEITPVGNGENVKPQTLTVNLKVKR